MSCMHGVLNPSTAYFDAGFNLLPTLGFGNKYCWQDGFDFYRCCRSHPDPACWSEGGLSFQNCCLTGGILWQLTGAQAVASPNVRSERELEESVAQLPCIGTASKARMLLALSETVNWCTPFKAAEWQPDLCQSAGGRLRNVTFNWAHLSGQCPQSVQEHILSIGRGAPGENCSVRPLQATLQLCISPECKVWEVIAGLSILHFYNVRQLNCTALLLQATTPADDPPKTGRVGRRDPPADLEAWRRMFWICGSCPLQRYGSSGDGGYLLCDLQNVTMAAAYSFGIDGRDEWGQEVASCTGATLFQFDCFNTTGAECRSQKTCPPTNFRAECLSAPGCFFDKPSGSLQEHFWRNHVGGFHPHAVADRSLLLKVDIEGFEWDVFATAEPKLLQKFSQIVVEFHFPFLRIPIPESFHVVHQRALKNLLSLFVVVHVHPNPGCRDPELGSCLEVTFAEPRLVNRHSCRPPLASHLDQRSLDEENLDLRSIFREP
ncbi:ASZ1 [Symbiodinium sp. CCMP2592]|nr:ASZ1 [Symbiodinium sp. CCMP2592]